jgi:hypothetical protein
MNTHMQTTHARPRRSSSYKHGGGLPPTATTRARFTIRVLHEARMESRGMTAA